MGSSTGWFPSNYVTPATAPTPQHNSCVNNNNVEEQSAEYQAMILNELIQSESAFISEMDQAFHTRINHICNSNSIKSQLEHTYAALIDAHKTHLLRPLLHSTHPVRIGHIFLTAAPALEAVHAQYCSLHPKFVQFVDETISGNGNHKSGNEQDKSGNPGNGNHKSGNEQDKSGNLSNEQDRSTDAVLGMIMCLSLPFRRLDRYGALLNDLDCHVQANSADKGDLRRSVQYYRALQVISPAKP